MACTSSQLSPSWSATAFWLAALSQSMASLSNSAVNRLEGSAQASFTARAPCSAQLLRGGSACRSSDTDRCPDAASGAPADGRRAGTAGRTPNKTTAHRLHAPDECELPRQSPSTQRGPLSRGIESPKSGHTVRDPALAHYELTHSNPG